MAHTFVSTGTTATFWIYQEQADISGDSLVVERLVPWASNVVIDQSGQGPRHFTCTAYTTSVGEFTTLEGLRGSLGTLTWAGGTWSAVLKSVAGANYHLRWEDAKLEFWLTT